MSDRAFRTEDSYVAERVTRDLVPVFLERQGLTNVRDVRTKHGLNESQEIRASLWDASQVRMRVRLCWRKIRDRRKRSRDYSAAQLLAHISGGDWEGSIQEKVDRERGKGITHFLLVQQDGAAIRFAALIPIAAILPIWRRQRDVSDRLIRAGALGRQKKNHAKNGSSPTLYLHDDRAAPVADALWSYPGVVDLALGDPSDHEGPTVSTGAGFGDAQRNMEVEQAAIGMVRRKYVEQGWNVRSLERERVGFDLLCQRDPEVLHVEVKGVRGVDETFQLTAGEVERAREDPRFRLEIVTSAVSREPRIVTYSGPQFLSEFDLTATQFRASRQKQ